MPLPLRLFGAVLIAFVFASTAAWAQQWRYEQQFDGVNGHAAFYKDFASVGYNVKTRSYEFHLGILDAPVRKQMMIKFTFTDDRSETYELKDEVIRFKPLDNSKVSVVSIPIAEKGINLLQRAKFVTLLFGEKEFRLPLTNSRAAIQKVMDAVNTDLARAADRQHTQAQAASDKEQAKTARKRCDTMTSHRWDQTNSAAPVKWANIDGPEAVKACERALELGSEVPRIVYQLGRAYDKVKDPKAFEAIRRAAQDLNYAAAYYHLGLLYEDGLYTTKDAFFAERAFKTGAALGNVPSAYGYGRLRFKDAQTDDEEEEAIDSIREAANAGYPFALTFLGEKILEGRITDSTFSQGIAYLEKASDLGEGDASYFLYTLYRDGEIVAASTKTAFKYLVLASKQGHEKAKEELGE